MSCIATWFSPKDGADNNLCIVELHVNLWKLHNTRLRRGEQFLDVGIMLDARRIKSLDLFLPFAI